MTELEQTLQARLRTVRAPYHSASDWDGQTYGYGAGRAHPSVEFVACPVCQAPAGTLYQGAHGPKFGTHYKRNHAYRDLKRRLGGRG